MWLTQVERHLEQEQEAEAENISEALQEADAAEDQDQSAELKYALLQNGSHSAHASIFAYNCGQCVIQSACKAPSK